MFCRVRTSLHQYGSSGYGNIGKLFLCSAMALSVAAMVPRAQPWTVTSPDLALTIEVKQETIDAIASGQKNCYFRVLLDTAAVVDWSPVGVKTSDQDYMTDLTFVKQSDSTILETYTLPAGKRSSYRNHCNEMTLTFSNRNSRQVAFCFRAYNEAAAVRSELLGSGTAQVTGEVTGFTFTSGTGWGHKPNEDEATYDQFTVGSSAAGYGIPILFKPSSGSWALVTEAAVYGDYTGCHFASKSASKNVYQIAFPSGQGAITGSLPWKLPWRVAIVGTTLGPIVESSVVENLNPPCELTDISWIKSGRSAWSWLSQETGDINQQKRYIDFANQMGWEYNLIDWNFNKSQVSDICTYGTQKQVGNELWYNYTEVPSQSQQNTIFPQCRTWGLKGLKIDFIYGSDNINYNNNIMKWFDMTSKNLAANKLMVTYHGCTVPRGQRRRWPNIMTYEGVKGYEYIGRGYPGTKHDCMLPFTRNVIGPMDHTPVLFTLGQLTNGSGSTRTSTDAHELATAVIYESGIQHFADRPEGYNSCIGKPFLQTVPSAWDDIRLIDGVPGEYVIMARLKGNDWYIAGIRALEAKAMQVSLSFLKPGNYTVDLYKDSTGTQRTAAKQTISVSPATALSVWVNTNGGFCCKIPDSYQIPVAVNRGGSAAPARKTAITPGMQRPSRFVCDGVDGKRMAGTSGNIVNMLGKTVLPCGAAVRLPAGVYIRVAPATK